MSEQSRAFENILAVELGHAERNKAGALALVSAVAVVATFLIMLLAEESFTQTLERPELRFIIPLVVLSVCLFEAGSWVVLGRLMERGTPRPRALQYLVVAIEASVPSVMLIVTSQYIQMEQPYASPFMLGYGIFLCLSALSLEPARCLFAGLVSSSSYMAVAVYVGMDAAVMGNAPSAHVGRAITLFMIGVSAALVAHQLRRRFEDSARALEDRNHVVGVFGRYITDEVVDVLLNSPDGLQLGGRKQPVTLIMTDLRGFSNLSEELPAERVVALLNHYLGEMTEVIQDCGGTIDEFIGDAILVVFNAPLPQPDHAALAVRCALAMQQRMEVVNRWNLDRGLPALEMGVGVNSGDVVVGNIGSERRQKYGVVGSQVNLTARIESYTVGGQVLISEQTAAAVGEGLVVRGEREVTPKGSAGPIRILDVVGLGDLKLEEESEQLLPIVGLEVGLRLLQGKDVSVEQLPARIVAMSPREAWLSTEVELEILDNVVIMVNGGQAFAKVREVGEQVRVRFTARDEVATKALKAALMAAGG